MPIHKTEFIQSNTDYKNCPRADRPEYAFIGRSNVGKSSLINMLTGNSKLAKVSSKPGKTRLLNHFLIDDSWYLVDLPGYGWAQVSKTERESMNKMNTEYLRYRPNLFCTFLLIDSRLELQAVDHEFMIWLGENQIPFAIVFTKTDKQGQTKNKLALEKYKEQLLQTWEHLPPIFLTSSSHQTGREEVLEYIFKLNQQFTLKE